MKNRSIRKILALGIVTTMLFGSLSFIPSVSASPEPAPTAPITLPDFIEISTDKRFYEVGEPVNISMTNNGDTPVNFSESRVFSVTRGGTAGYVVAPFWGGPLSPITWTLNPGDTESWDWNQHHYSWAYPTHLDTGIQVPTDIYRAWFANGGDHDSAFLTIVNPAIEVTTDKNEYLPEENVVITVTNIALPEFPYPLDVYCLFVDENGDVLWDDIINDVNLTVNESLQYTWNQINFDGQHVPIGNWTVMVKFMYSFAAYDDKYVNAASFILKEAPVVIGEWQKLNGPYGAYVADLVVDPNDSQIIYAAIDGGGVYKSYDAGKSWVEINNGITDFAAWDIAIDPNNSQVIYVGTWNDGVFKTYDGGFNWQHVRTGRAWGIAINPMDSNILYVVSRDGVHMTADGGDTWNSKNNGITNLRLGSIYLDPINPNILYVGNWMSTDNLLYKCIDGGESWSVSSDGLDSTASITSIAIDPQDSSIVYIGTDAGVFKSVDSGDSWYLSGNGLTNQYVRDVEIDPTNPDILYVATWCGLFKSLDAGGTWSLISQDFHTNITKTVVFNPNDSQTIYVGVFGGVYKSSDGGTLWTFINEGLTLDSITSFRSFAIDPYDSNTIYIGTFGGGFFKSIDGGHSWFSINSGIDIAYANGGIKLASPLYVATDGGGIYKSVNYGESWVQKNDGLTNRLITRIQFHPEDHDIIYLSTGGGVFKSTNGGDNWYPLNNGLPSYGYLSDILVNPLEPQILYVATRSEGIYKSSDGGNTWTPSNNGIFDLAIRTLAFDPQNPEIVYAGARGAGVSGIFKSTDGGESWIYSSIGIEGCSIQEIIVNPSNPQIIYVGTYGHGVFRSLDGGRQWKALNDGLSNLVIEALVLDPQNPYVFYIGTDAGAYKWSGDATVGIKPDTLNLKSKGKWVTAYIELSGNYDVGDINVSTILLNGQVPSEIHPTEIGDYDNDGIPDLMVKFDRKAVQAILQEGDKIKITVTGELLGGTRFIASDIIRVINP